MPTEKHSNKRSHKVVLDHLDAVHAANAAVHEAIVERVRRHAEQRSGRQQQQQQEKAP